jgi:hypothetical protein
MTATTLLSDNGASSGTSGYKLTGGNDGTLQLQTTTSGGAATTAVTIDTSQNVGIGTSSPGAKLDVRVSGATTTLAGLGVSNGTASGIFKVTGATYSYRGVGSNVLWVGGDSTPMYVGPSTAQPLILGNAAYEYARIDTSGNLLVGTTGSYGGTISIYRSGSAYAITTYTNANNYQPASFRNAAGTEVGYIYSTATATTYGTSSDYRLKENVQPMQGALATVAQLKPVTYTWKADGSTGQGFIAHELQEVVPDCVTGEKDAVDEDGNPKYQGIDTSFLVATLTAAIQEQQAIITSLTERVAALEGAQA